MLKKNNLQFMKSLPNKVFLFQINRAYNKMMSVNDEKLDDVIQKLLSTSTLLKIISPLIQWFC